nr:basic 7S globulin 2-like [Tanacetum cinerariifolium]
MLPGWGYCTCPVNVVDPISGSCSQAILNYDDFTVNTSNGKNIFTGLYGANPNAACASTSTFQSFPANVNGVMAFSSSPYALPAYLYQPLKRSLTLCLPSNPTTPGVLFFGAGPYYLLPQSDVGVPDIDLILPNGKKWTVATANSIKQLTRDVACLAFVDGG